MQRVYHDDLAYIHDVGFADLAESAGVLIIRQLARSGMTTGTIVDLGCGSGITARMLRTAGIGVTGFDISEPMIALARQRVPDAKFCVESFLSADIPPCVAVTAIGEVFNYTFDPANSVITRARTLEKIFSALAPEGILLFDMAGPGRTPRNGTQRTFAEGSDWAVLVAAEANDTANVLTRHITTFRKQGTLYRRGFEIHRLQLVGPAEVVQLLQDIGFSVQTLNAYGKQALPQGVVGFLARKSGRTQTSGGI